MSKNWVEQAVALVFGVAAALIVTGMLYKVVFTPKVVDFCYVEGTSTNTFELKGHIPWSMPDAYRGQYPAVEAAVKAAELMHCPLK
jgi:hypothetical protein